MKAPGEMSESPIQIVIADDDAHIRTLLNYTLERAGFRTITASNGRQALDLMHDETDVALLDVKMPVLDGLQCLMETARIYPDVQVIMITAHTDIRDAVGAIKNGAFDYVAKPFNPEELIATVQQAARYGRLRRENRRLKQAIASPAPPVAYIGSSESSRRLLENARRLARTEGNLLLTGETGVGKSLLARLIHSSSTRSGGPFVTVNCTTLPRELVESELFGHERGSFTGASERRLGRVEMAEGGTLFLDEIGEMPLDLQPKLLTFLQDRMFQRVGGNHDIRVDVRVVAATNQDLLAKVHERRFREDLFFRISVLTLPVPPLRDHLTDIQALAEYHLERIARRNRQPAKKLSPRALEALMQYHWPGNMRELENVLEQATAFADGPEIDLAELPSLGSPTSINTTAVRPLAGITLDDLERMAIEQTLEVCHNNKARAARMLGISEKTVYNKIKRLGIKSPD